MHFRNLVLDGLAIYAKARAFKAKAGQFQVGLHRIPAPAPAPARIRRFFPNPAKIRLRSKFCRSRMLLPDVKNAHK